MGQFKALLFDAGNTLLDFRGSEQRAIEILRARTGHQVAEQDALPYFQAAFSHAFGDGLLWVTDRESELRYWASYYEGWLRAIDIAASDALVSELVRDTLDPAMYSAFPDSQPVLEELRRRSFGLALVSNAFPSMRTLIEQAGLGEYFDPALYSCEIGCEKPQREIFERALSGLGVAPDEALFVDDVPANIEAAAGLGISSLLLDRWERHPYSTLPRIPDLYAVLEAIG